MRPYRYLKVLGPGLLYAAAAIGVSHLVQSTRAGADFGFQLLWAVIIANILKYPFFKVGPKYTAVTGKSLLEGWKSYAPWAIPLFFILSILTMFTVQAAVTIVTAGLSLHLFDLNITVQSMSLIILFLCSSILFFNKYNILDNIVKVIVLLLTVSTITCLVLAYMKGGAAPLTPEKAFSFKDNTHIFFLIALVGWMPAPMDIPIWHSMWSLEKNKSDHSKSSLDDTLLDFNIGYIGTAILACCFLSLGALVMYRSGEIFSNSAATFSTQLINMYTQILGSWSLPIISVAAFATMFSTTLTCLDAFPRILNEACRIQFKSNTNTYKKWLIITATGALVILYQFLSSMKALVDFATTLSFVVSPIYAYLIYKAMNSSAVPEKYHIKGIAKIMAVFAMIFFTIFTLYFLYLKFF